MRELSRRQAVAAATGERLWSYPLGADAAIIAVDGDAAYVLDVRGGMYALRR